MARIETVDKDISEDFGESPNTVILSLIIRQDELPDAALIINHKTKQMSFYEYEEGDTSISLSLIKYDKALADLQAIVTDRMSIERLVNGGGQ